MKSGLTKHQLEIIAETVMKEQKKQEKRQQVERKDWRLRNTRLLLQNYRFLQKHCEEIHEDLTDYEEIIFDPEDLNIQVLMKYKARTKKMLDYFDTIWGSYREYCVSVGGANERRMKVIQKRYISNTELSKFDLAEMFGVDESTIRRDEKKAVKELSVFLFGIDSLEDLTTVLS